MKVLKKIQAKSCCGSKNLTLIFDSSYSASLASFLKEKKFYVMEPLIKSGCLYSKMNGMILTGILNSSKIEVRCQGSGCDFQIQNLISELEKYESAKIPSK